MYVVIRVFETAPDQNEGASGEVRVYFGRVFARTIQKLYGAPKR